MKSSVRKEIQSVVFGTKAHKDTFAVPELMGILQRELEHHSGKKKAKEELILQFVEWTVEAMSASPIYSETLVRQLYQSVLQLAARLGIEREGLLEDLLFQSIRRPAETDVGKRKKQKDARARILRAALEEFSEKGFYHCTIDSIALRAGIAKGTVYRYFKTKTDLYNALKEDTINEFVELAKKEVSADADILRILENVVRIYLEFFERNSAFFKVIIQEQKDFGREFSEKFISELIVAFPGLKRACWKASRRGQLKQMNYYTVFFGIVGFLNGVIQKWLHDGCRGSLLDEVDTVKEVLFFGLASPPDEEIEASDTLKVIS